MKVYITSVGEKTTAICAAQLKRYGFEVDVLNGVEPWLKKYKRFLELATEANEPCLRVDADVIVNSLCNPKEILSALDNYFMAQFQVYDFYKNGLSTGQPVAYSPKVFEIINRNLGSLDYKRPETSAWRMSEINTRTVTVHKVLGMHGYFQDSGTMARAMRNKKDRKQIDDFDFDLVQQLLQL